MVSDSDEDIVLSKRSRVKKVKSEEDETPTHSQQSQHSYSAVSDGDSDEAISVTAKKSLSSKRKASDSVKQPKKKIKKEQSSKVAKPRKKASTPKPKTSKSSTPKPEDTPKEDGEDGEDVYKWWENEQEDDSIKWDTLEHNGVIFPPEYEPLPSHVKLYYDGKPVNLPPAVEEVAGFFGALLGSDHAENPTFQKNFFQDFLKVLDECSGCGMEIKEFKKCDFSKMFSYFEAKKEEKKAMTNAEKKKLKADKDAFEEPYKHCFLNGHKEQVGNFRVEPPGLFRGRGAHPKTGKLKRRVNPEDVILNLGKDVAIPEPPQGHSWGEIRHDNQVSWLAMWRENISNSVKYVRFAANSSLKGMSDFKKFEKARELKLHIEKIRKDYRTMLKDQLMINRQIATATYLIDIFALRAGGEKSDDEADTVGCCSLRFEHITLAPPNKVVFDFLGKDSIRFYQEVAVDPQVFKNLKIFKRAPKAPGDDLFDRIDPGVLNKHFQKYMVGLTAKVFRTYNASKTMQDQLDLISNEGTPAEKVVHFNAANRTVAILCNHQRTVSKGHQTAMEKINAKLKETLWQKIRFKQMMLVLDPKLKKKRELYFEECDDLTKEDIAGIHQDLIAREYEKYEKKFKRENEKRVEAKEELLPASTLEEWKGKVKDLEKDLSKELKSGKPEVPGNATIASLEAQVEKLEKRITNTTLQMKDKEDNSQVALSTSKINYIDPRLSVVFCKKYNVPIEKIFTKTLREKFKWAIESAGEDWRF